MYWGVGCYCSFNVFDHRDNYMTKYRIFKNSHMTASAASIFLCVVYLFCKLQPEFLSKAYFISYVLSDSNASALLF